MNNIIFNTLLDMEIDLGLLSRKINGFSFWIYYRVSFFERLNNELYSLGEAFATKGFDSSLIRTLIRVMTDKNYNIMRQSHKADYAIFCDPMRYYIDDKFVSPFTDYFYESIRNAICFERPYNYRHKEPIKTEKIVFLDRFYWGRAFRQNFKIGYKHKFIYSISSILLEIVEYLNLHDIPVKVNIGIEALSIWNLFIRYKYMKKRFIKLISFVNPKVIIEVQYYNFENMVLNEIAKKRGIKSIEMQHGLISPKHFAYNFRKENNSEQLPDYIFTFGEYWNTMANYPINKNHIISVGYPYFENETKKAKRKHALDKKNTVMFLSQGTIGRKLHKLAIEYSKIVKDGINIVYKLHPGEFSDWKQRYPNLVTNNRINVITNEIPLYDLFAISRTIIGVSSTSIYEGLGFDVQVCIFNIEEADHMERLYQEGLVKLINTANEIDSCMMRPNNRKFDQIWKPNGLENILRELDTIKNE